MKKTLLVVLAIVCGVTFSDCYARKPKKEKMTNEEIITKLDSLRREHAKAIDENTFPVRYIDTIRIDSIIEVPIYRDYNLRLMMPQIHYYNRVNYIKHAFGGTDKDKYYCATGRGEAETYNAAIRLALSDAVMKIYKYVGDGTKLSGAELLMAEEDKLDDEVLTRMKEAMLQKGDSNAVKSIQENENIRKVEVAIRMLKANNNQ